MRELYLHNCKIGDAGAQAIAGAMVVNKSLVHVTLSHNNLGGPAYVALGDMLKHNSSLQELSVMRLSNHL